MKKKGEHGNEKVFCRDEYDDADVHALLLYVQGFLRTYIRYVLHFRGTTACRLVHSLCVHIVFDRGTLSKSPGYFFLR